MPKTVTDAVTDTAAAAAGKAEAVRRPGRYLVSSMLAGAYVGVAVVLLVSVCAPLAAAGSPFTKLVQALVFGIALTLVVFAGAELFTGNVMTMLQGLTSRRVRPRQLLAVCGLSLLGNAAGSLALAWAVTAGGTLQAAAGPAGAKPALALLAALVKGKNAASGPQLFWRALLCNALVCLALWMAARASTDGAKLAVLWWGLLAFVGSGFEHSVANITTFALAAFAGLGTWADLLHNLSWTVPGNVAGGVLVALAYAWTQEPARTPAEVAVPAPRSAADAEVRERAAAR